MAFWLYLIFIASSLLFYFIRRINKPPKELEFIPTVSFFKYFSILLSNGGQLEIQKLIRESDPNKIGLVKIFTYGWTIHITDIEYAKSFFSENVHTLPKLEFPTRVPSTNLFGKGILMSNGDHWAQQRKVASPAFNQVLRPDMVGECTNEFIKLLNKWTDTPIDVLSLSKRLTIQILGKLAFTYDMKFDNYIFEIIEQRRLEMSKEKNENENTDLLTGILEAANCEDDYYTNKELRDNLVNYFVAGNDSKY
ncbi:26123_t:CDS:2 [Dentiscutata erythropus]|uniref:26123_t:CDS:1 n=1 Tax=Dentiscutata erythropus TaxID=1348616 RepID=A0A9N9EPX5_9GLOM|nr:26123_t:CDS:2 [Dentiscutata erythropus]